MTIDTEKLRRLAQAATPGPWEIIPTTRVVIGDTSKSRCAVCDYEPNAPQAEADCRFITAANPAAVLELLKEIERLRDIELEVERLRALLEEVVALLKDSDDPDFKEKWDVDGAIASLRYELEKKP